MNIRTAVKTLAEDSTLLLQEKDFLLPTNLQVGRLEIPDAPVNLQEYYPNDCTHLSGGVKYAASEKYSSLLPKAAFVGRPKLHVNTYESPQNDPMPPEYETPINVSPRNGPLYPLRRLRISLVWFFFCR